MATLAGPSPAAQAVGRDLSSMQVPGGSSILRVIDGMEGVLKSNQAAVHEIQSVASAMRISNERSSRMSTEIATLATTQSAMVKSITASMEAATRTMVQMVQQAQGGRGPIPGVPTGRPGLRAPQISSSAAGDPYQSDGGPGPTSQWTPSASSMPPQMRHGAGRGAGMGGAPGDLTPAAGDHPRSPAEAESNYDRLMGAKGYSIGRLRQDTSGLIGRKISEAQFGPNMRQSSTGQWMNFDPRTDETTGQSSLRDIRNLAIANKVRTIGGEVAEKGLAKGLLGALPAGVGLAASAVVGGVVVADQAAKFVARQRDENANFQRVLGGSNTEGFAERAKRVGFSFAQTGVMDARQAGDLYTGVTSLGLTGAKRTSALDLATENWKKFGMDINASIDLIRIASRNGLDGLTGMAGALDKVTASARAGGVNADKARQQFTQGVSAGAPTLSGESSTIISGALTAANAKLGPRFSSLSAANAVSESTILTVGAVSGYNPAQASAAYAGGPGGVQYVKDLQKQIVLTSRMLLGTGGVAMIRDWKTKNKGRPMTAAQAEELGIAIGLKTGLSPLGAQAALARWGQDVLLKDAIGFMILAVDGEYDPAGSIDPSTYLNTQKTLSEKDRTNLTGSGKGGSSTIRDVASAIGAPVRSTSGTNPGDGPSVDGATGARTVGGSTKGDSMTAARNSYLAQIGQKGAQGGRSSSIIEALLKKGDNSTRFRVNAGTEKNPKWREVNTADAVRDYRDQLARGDVEITNGDSPGQTIASALGMQVDEKAKFAPTSAKGRRDGKDYDPKPAKGTSQSTKTGGVVSGSVEIYPTPELSRLLRLRPGSTTTPPSGRGANNDYPTG